MIIIGQYVDSYITWCAISDLSRWIVAPAAGAGHILLAINRIWAVTFPQSYRLKYNRILAMLSCVLMHIIVDVRYLSTAILAVIFGSLPYVMIMRRIQVRRIVSVTSHSSSTSRQLAKGTHRIYIASTVALFLGWSPAAIDTVLYPTWTVAQEATTYTN
ncbi:uncharacterized protein LOC129582847 [Paramacrobiotus metropolitanus]|uniref:uncharacterized protein LOC129582847 n=1 Tax=Paramacrobiotus metropolitanus TaxID=2943436 RepID=UPI002446155C|nr:uncharacterized protein LOC129582847 [Paramacrobiotus metropolitanus]